MALSERISDSALDGPHIYGTASPEKNFGGMFKICPELSAYT